MEAHWAPVSDDLYIHYALDITEHKRAEEKLQEQERLIHQALSISSSFTFDWDTATEQVNRSAGCKKIFGIDGHEMCDAPSGRFFQRVHPDDRSRFEKALRDLTPAADTYAMDFRLVLSDGSVVTLEETAQAFFDAAGEIKRVIGVATDITGRRQIEEELRRSYDELELRVQERTETLRRQAELLELAHNAILVRDMENRITFWNRGAEEMYGWTKDEAKGAFIHHLLKTKFPVSPDDTITALMRAGTWEGELERITKDGRNITIHSRRALQRDEAGNPAAIIEINLDVTAARQAEEQLRQSHKMEAIGTLAGGIAHDFNNILAAILGFTEMAIDDVPDRPLAERNLQNVLKSAMRARDLVKQILAFSRKTNYERTPLSLAPLIKETVQLLRASIPATVEIRLAATANSDMVLASPVEVQQVLMNLATNASLAMQGKGGTLEISLADIDFTPDSPVFAPDVRPGEYVQLAVKDTGIGMSSEVMKRVFEPFFTTREVGKGTGMGLAVVYGIVNDLRGTVTVESKPGVGSIFRVLLPKAKTEPEEEQPRTVQIPGGKERILFVDDEDMLVEWGRMTLERLGYMVAAATDSAEALKTFASDPDRFDLVITDQTMSGLTGIQLSKELLKIKPHIPVLLCAGHSETVSPDTVKEAGIAEFLMKPITKQELAAAVRRVLDADKKE
jgi:PAS domain S-box-containing protein